MLAKVYVCLALLVSVVSFSCFGVQLYIDNQTDIPLMVTVLKGTPLTTAKIVVSARGFLPIGILGHRTSPDNVDRIVDVNPVEDWKLWAGRLVRWQHLPQLSDKARVRLDTILSQLKKRAELISPDKQLAIEVSLDESGDFTFHGKLLGEWVIVNR